MPLEAPAIRHFIGHKCLTSLIPSLSILLHVTVWEWDKSRMVWEWDRPSVWFVTLSCQSPISVRCAVALRPSVLWWPVTISHFSPNERFWPACGCEGCVCVWCVCVCVCVWWLYVMVVCDGCVCVCVRRGGLITAWTYYYDDYGVSGVRIKQTCYKMLQEVTCINNWVHTHTSRFLQWLAALSHSARHCRSFNCMQHTSYHRT